MSAEISLYLLRNIPRICVYDEEIRVPNSSLDLLIYLAVENQSSHDRDVLTRRLYESTVHRDKLRQTALHNLPKSIRDLCIRPSPANTVGYDAAHVSVDVHDFTALLEDSAAINDPFQVYGQLVAAYDLYQDHFLADYSPTLYGLTSWILEQRRTLREQFHGLLERLVQYEIAEGLVEQAHAHAERWHQSLPDSELPLQYLIWLAATMDAHMQTLSYLRELEALGSPDLRVIGYSPQEWRWRLDRGMKPDVAVLRLGEFARVEVSELLERASEHLIGRDKSLEAVFQTLFVDQTTNLLTITGARGIGKTALGEAAAAACLRRGLVDRVIQVGVTAETDFDAVLNAIARKVDKPHLADLDYRNKYVSIEQLFEGAASLLILDQQEAGAVFTDEFKARVRALSAQIRVIVCCLDPWPEVHNIRLEPLDLLAVSRLFQSTTGSNLDAADDVALSAATQGSPLALRLFVSAMTSRNLSLREALDQLSRVRADQQLAHHEQILAWCWHLLDDVARRVLASLVDFDLLEGPDSALLHQLHDDLPEPRIDAALQDLLTMGLIELAGGQETIPVYRWHSLLHEFLERIDNDDPQFKARIQARFCVLQFDYLARYADDSVLLDRNQRNLLHAFDLGFARGSVGLARVNAFIPYLLARGAYEAARRIADQALQDLVDEASADSIELLLNSAKLDVKRGELQTAEQQLEEALAHAGELEESTPLGEIYQQLGIIVKLRGQFEQSGRYLEKALHFARQTSDSRLICTILANMGSTAVDRGDYEAARAYLTESLKFAEAAQQLRVIEFTHTALGVIAIEQFDFELALRYLEEAQVRARQLGSPERQAIVDVNVGAVDYFLHRYTEARDHLLNALGILQRLQNDNLIAHCVRNLGRLDAAQGNALDAEQHFREAYTLAVDRGQARLAASVLLDIGKVSFQVHDTQFAQRCFHSALRQSLDIENYNLAAEALFGLGITTVAAAQIIGANDINETVQTITSTWDTQLLAQLSELPITEELFQKAEFLFQHGLINFPDIPRYRVADALAQLVGTDSDM